MLGLHWFVDATDCRSHRMADPDHVRHVLIDLPARLGLTRVGDPQMFEHSAGDDAERTVAGLVLIAESHLSLHVRPGLSTLHADLFSCKAFDTRAALAYLEDAFGFTHYREHTFERGPPRVAASPEEVR